MAYHFPYSEGSALTNGAVDTKLKFLHDLSGFN
jgi:hypothetical protein